MPVKFSSPLHLHNCSVIFAVPPLRVHRHTSFSFYFYMAETIDTYLNSSPPGSPNPSLHDSEEDDFPGNPAPHTPLASQAIAPDGSHQLMVTPAIVRPDMGHFTLALSRNLGLNAAAHEELIKFARVGTNHILFLSLTFLPLVSFRMRMRPLSGKLARYSPSRRPSP